MDPIPKLPASDLSERDLESKAHCVEEGLGWEGLEARPGCLRALEEGVQGRAAGSVSPTRWRAQQTASPKHVLGEAPETHLSLSV